MSDTTQIYTDEQIIRAKAGIEAYEIEIGTLAVTRKYVCQAIARYGDVNHNTFTVDLVNAKFSEIIEILDKESELAHTRCNNLRVVVKEASQ